MKNSFIGLCFLILVISGCSGSGSSSSSGGSVSGVAAAGAPISGQVTLTDSLGVVHGPVPIDVAGRYTIDTTGVPPPFVVKATGVVGSQPYTLYAIVSEAGQANINPISNAISAIALGGDPETVLASNPVASLGVFADGERLRQATEAVKNLLAPLLAWYGVPDFSPVTGSYAADPSDPVDVMLDLIMVRISGNEIVITNKLNGGVIAIADLASPASASVLLTNAESSAAVTDIQEITQQLALLCSVMNLGAELTAQDLEDFFVPDPAYGTSGGYTRAENIASIVTIFGPNGTNQNGKLASIRNLRLVSNLTADYAGRGVDRAYLLNYDFIFESGVVVAGHDVTFGKETSTGKWKFIGSPVQGPVGDNSGFVLISVDIPFSTEFSPPPIDPIVIQEYIQESIE